MMSLEQVHERLNVWGFPHEPLHLGEIGNFPIDINLKTLIMTWITMTLVIVFLVKATRGLSLHKPGKLQVVVEMMYDFLKGLAFENIDTKKAAPLLSLILSIFSYLLFCNLLGLVPTMMSPTADINTTIGMALMVFVLLWIQGLKYKGLGHFKHFVTPYALFLPINILEELAKPVTLAFRLYGNIYAGEVLIAVLLGMIGINAFLFGGFIPSVIWLLFSIFVSCIQAFIFTMLTIAYTSQVVADSH